MIWADVNVGNMSAASGALVSGVERAVSANTSHTLNGLRERNFDTSDVAVDSHRVSLQ